MNLEALIELRAKVEDGEPEFDWGFAPSPSRKALPTQWQYALNAYLGSLEAAYALTKAVLPGFNWTLRETVEGWDAEVGKPDTFSEKSGEVSCSATFTGVSFDNPGRAWLLAILSALIAKETPDDGN